MNKLQLFTTSAFLITLIFTLTALTNKGGKTKHEQIDSLRADREKHKQHVLELIKGKEKLPSDSVFKSIEIFKGVPAGRLLSIMDMAFSQSLGVSCGHCHNTKDFSSEEKPEKQIAREMWVFAAKTRDLLKDVKGLKSDNPTINCTTCHRGQVKPALSLN